MEILEGIDVSYYDNIINWSQYQWTYAFIKCSEGTVIDSCFTEQWNKAKGFIYRSAYHFFHPPASSKLAAHHFVDFMQGDLGELPPVLDLERLDFDGKTAEKALEWIAEFRKLTGIKPIIYTSPSFINAAKLYNFSEFQLYKLWLAQYPYDKMEIIERSQIIKNVIDERNILMFPHCPYPFKRLAFWQWTAKGLPSLVHGYPQNYKLAVDFNQYNGSEKQFLYEFNLKDLGENEVEDKKTLYTIELKEGQECFIRSSPNINSSVINQATGPVTFSVVSEPIKASGYIWYEIKNPTGFIAATSRFEQPKKYTDEDQTPIPQSIEDKIKEILITTESGKQYKATTFIQL